MIRVGAAVDTESLGLGKQLRHRDISLFAGPAWQPV